jgi:AcrR family transcriptional regulator
MGLSEALGSDDRSQQILDAALLLILRQGYDKTSIGDVAAEAGISRGTVYLYFANKERLVEALVLRESTYYVRAWLEFIERDESASIGAIYQAVLYAIDQRPLLAALLKGDRRMIGSYLRKPGSLFASLEAMSVWDDLLIELQAAGAVRQDVDTAIMTHIMDMLSYGFISADDFKPADAIPPLNATLAAVAAMLDGALTPPDGGNPAAAREIIRRRALVTRTQFEAFVREWESTRTK